MKIKTINILNWNYLIYSLLSLLASIGIFIQNKQWLEKKKKTGELDDYDRGRVNPRDWLLIICFGIISLVYFLKFVFS
jgi:hypothetical protein